MSVISVFLDKDKYFSEVTEKGILVDGFEIKNLADIMNFYLSKVQKIDTIYIAGGWLSAAYKTADDLVKACFGDSSLTTHKYDIYLIRKYGKADYKFTIDGIKKNHHHHCSSAAYDTLKSDHRKMVYFASEGKITAVLIGSSNFSHTAYLTSKNSEADLLMIDNPKKDNVNKDVVKLLKYQATTELDGGGALKNNYDSLINNVLVSESFNGEGFLQSMFDDLTSDSNYLKYE